MKQSIFISSTYKDLKPHRNAIWKVLQTFEVGITGMEAFGAQKIKPLDTCLHELEKSNIYIGIISMCYGSIDECTGKSFTQLEYERAKELGLDILIYLVDETCGVLKTGDIDFGDKYLRLCSFKKILINNHTVDFFTDETDLGQKINKKLESLITKPDIAPDRPKELDAKVFHFNLENSKWCIIIGYLNGKPFEIFSLLKDDDFGLILPDDVSYGKIIKDFDEIENSRYDFCYPSRRGYTTTFEGINYSYDSQICSYDRIISRLMQNNISQKIILNAINEMEVVNNEYANWKNIVIDIIKN